MAGAGGAPESPGAGLLRGASLRTYRAERIRALFAGVLEPAFGTFLLLVALRQYGATPAAKAVLVAGPSVGLMAGPVIVALVEACGVRVAAALACLTGGAAGCLGMAALAQSAWSYVVWCAMGGGALTCSIPLMTQVYQNNYPEALRGKLFSDALFLRILMATGVSQFLGWWMSRFSGEFRVVVLAFSLAAAGAAGCWWGVPSEKLEPNPAGGGPLRGLRFLREDAVFRRTLLAWMLMGVGNLVMLPLRIEQLARPVGGVVRSAAQIAFLTAVVPNLARLVATPLWGRAFDRLDFFKLRAGLNCGFALAVLSFFVGESFGWMRLGAVLYGVSQAGGDVAWSLWVTKMAPPQRVADYMSVHTLLTGVRGVVAPAVAFHAIERCSIGVVGWVCVGLIGAANGVLWPEIRAGRSLRRVRAGEGPKEGPGAV